MTLCDYKNLLGEPNKGIHSVRVGKGVFGSDGLAVFDIALAIALGWVISKIFNMSFVMSLTISVIFGISLHRIFCVKTPVDQFLFKDTAN
jgi:hypothetical protein